MTVYEHTRNWLDALAVAILQNRPFCFIGSSNFQSRTIRLVHLRLMIRGR